MQTATKNYSTKANNYGRNYGRKKNEAYLNLHIVL